MTGRRRTYAEWRSEREKSVAWTERVNRAVPPYESDVLGTPKKVSFSATGVRRKDPPDLAQVTVAVEVEGRGEVRMAERVRCRIDPGNAA